MKTKTLWSIYKVKLEKYKLYVIIFSVRGGMREEKKAEKPCPNEFTF
jgi:hypothetical protein